MIQCIDNVDDRELFWNEYHRIRKHIAAAAQHNGDPQWERHLMRDLLFDKDAVLWTGTNSAAVTRIMTWNNQRTLIYSLVGGNMEEIMDEGEPIILDYARKQGCTASTTFCRKGFERVLPKWGWQFQGIVMTKEIDE